MGRSSVHLISTSASAKIRRRLSRTSSKVGTKGDNEYTNIDVTQMEADLKYLRSVSQQDLQHLDAKTSEVFQRVVEKFKSVHGCSAYHHLYNLMLKIFDDVPVRKGTLSAYFLGCKVKTCHDDKSCSEICATALPNPDHKPCPYSIFSYGKELRLLSMNHQSKKALVYVDYGVKFLGFTTVDRDFFLSSGIQEIVVYRSYSEEKMLVISNFDKYPWRPVVLNPDNNRGSSTNGQTSGPGNSPLPGPGNSPLPGPGNSDWNNWWIWLAVVAVIIIVVILVAYYIFHAGTTTLPSGPRSTASYSQRERRSAYPVIYSEKSPFLFF